MTTQESRGSQQTVRPQAGATEVRGRAADTFASGRAAWRETKPSFMTTEFWAMLIGVAALIVTYNVADEASFDLWRLCVLCTVLAGAYILSRGWAKSGAYDSRDDTGR